MTESEIDATWYQRPPGIKERISAGGIVVRTTPEGPLIAFAREQNHPLYVLPKGGVEAGETIEEAARREILEEAGISDLQVVRYLGTRPRLNYRKDRWMVIHYFLFTTQQVEGTPTHTERHYGLWWFPLSSLPPMLWPEQRQLIETVLGKSGYNTPMPATLILRNKEYEARPGITLRMALKKHGIQPDTVLATRNGEMLTDDEVVKEGDVIKLVTVISGG